METRLRDRMKDSLHKGDHFHLVSEADASL